MHIIKLVIMKHFYTLEKQNQMTPGNKKTKGRRILLFIMLVPFLIMSACMDDDFEGELRDVCPKVETHTPQALDDRVPLNSNVTVSFNKQMKPESINPSTFIVRDASGPIAGSISYTNKTATFTPTGFLPELTDITVEVTTQVYDLYDFTLEEKYQWAFTTGTLDDISSPYVVNTIPDEGEEDIMVNTIVSAIFNEALDPNSIGGESISLVNMDNGQTVAGVVSYSDMVITFTPNQDLNYETTYEAVVAAGVADLNGNVMENDYSWQFTTKKQIFDEIPLPINLGLISGYAILAGTYITNLEGQTSVTGDVGLYPGVTANITGITEGDVDGDIFATGPIPIPGLPQKLIRDKLILKIAYTNAANADDPQPIFLSGNQGGKTLSPGIYEAKNLKVFDGDLTLDAGGNPYAFWIFQVESLLETGGNIILEGGADPERIFWQVGIREVLGPNVLIGENTEFFGTILSKQGISVKSGGSVTGRLMVKDGGVRLRNATISLP